MIPRRVGPSAAWGALAGCLLAYPTVAAGGLPVPVALRGTLAPDGTAASIQITVVNRTDRASDAGALEVYLSADGFVDAGDARLVRHQIAALAPDARVDVTVEPSVPPSAPGRYYLVARVVGAADAAAVAAKDVLWGAPLAIGPDLTLADVRATAERDRVVLAGLVRNRGTTVSPESTVGAWWTPRDGSPGRRAAATAAVSAIPPGEAASFALTLEGDDVPTGAYGLDVEVDPDRSAAEADDENNRLPVDVAYFMGPDLVVGALSARQEGDGIVVHDAVRNAGNRASAACGIIFILSRNGVWDADDVSLGYRIVPALDTDGVSEAETRLALPKRGLPTGRYFLLGKVDGANHVAESREDNNLTMAPAPVDIRGSR